MIFELFFYLIERLTMVVQRFFSLIRRLDVLLNIIILNRFNTVRRNRVRQVNDVIKPGTEITQVRAYEASYIPSYQAKYYIACVRLYTTITLSVANLCAWFIYLHASIHMLSAKLVGQILGAWYGAWTKNYYRFNDEYTAIFQTFYFAAYIMDDHAVDPTVDLKKKRILKNCFISLLIFFAPSMLNVLTSVVCYSLGDVVISTHRYYVYLLIRAMFVHYVSKSRRRYAPVEYYVGQTVLSYVLSTVYVIGRYDETSTTNAIITLRLFNVRVVDSFARKFVVILVLRCVYGFVMWKLIGLGLRTVQSCELPFDLTTVKVIEALALLKLVSPAIVTNRFENPYVHVVNVLIAGVCGFKMNFLMRQVYAPMVKILTLRAYAMDQSSLQDYVTSKNEFVNVDTSYELEAHDQVLDFVIMDLKAGLPYVFVIEHILHVYGVNLMYRWLIQSLINTYLRLRDVFNRTLNE